MTHIQPELPYSNDALSPHITAKTIEFHYGKHHAGYVTKLNKGVKGTEFDGKSLEEVIKSASGGIFNNAAQVWNHTFYWNCLSPNGGGNPSGQLASLINDTWTSFDNFKTEFSNAAATNFGSGWTWLVKDKAGKLKIMNTNDADTPLRTGETALLTLDVWEHAYYLDYQNARPSYIESFWKLVNWDFANKNLV